ncbi:hypothetical protein TARUN_5471 [Trichoderma arundinaceum]|uniref:DUF7905 domain-containing protein n=1 Tax=Trichoderma arundinaceum TaxID=490622 RepID=A0A395NL40_TRIAR|nr:hypothetical protein TARUN_5471 [Trichoderma arundinaceum]
MSSTIRGRGREAGRPSSQSNPRTHDQYQLREFEVPKQQWGTAKRMASAKAQVNDKRLVASVAGNGDYLGQPPADRDLIEAQIVTSGNFYLFPPVLGAVSQLNDIRKLHQVWITTVEGKPYIFRVFSESVSQLQAAVDAINQRIHDLRLSRELLTPVIIVHKSLRVAKDAMIRFERKSRASLISPPTERTDVSRTTAALLQELHPLLLSSTECLMSVTMDLRMRVNLGILEIQQRKKGQANEITYGEFAELAKMYSVRGGLMLDIWFADIRAANGLIKHLLAYDDDNGLRLDHKSKRRTHSLRLKIGGSVIWLEDWTNDKSALSQAKMGTSWPTAWLDWSVASPDSTFDWGLKAESYGFSTVPPDIQKLIKGLEHSPVTYKDADDSLRPSGVIVGNEGDWGQVRVSETELKTSFVADFQDTPYVLEISISQFWNGIKTKSKPDVTWGVELYGKHWDSAMNQINPIDGRKDWGEGQKNVWPGTDPDLGKRFSSLLQVIVQLQQQINDMGTTSKRELVADSEQTS